MIVRTSLTLLLAAGIAAAQGGAIDDKIREQVAEISRLMRESERLLLEITRVDRLVETQKQIEEEMKKLLPPEQPAEGGAGADEQAQKRQQLEAKHAEISQRLQEMLQGEREKAAMTVQQLEELLKRLPQQQQPMGGGGSGEPQSKEEREKRLREQQEERKQHEPMSPRREHEETKDRQQRTDKRRAADETAAARIKRTEAWIARLPPEDQERINRNDFSRVPARYRPLVEEYTAHRAKREAEREPEADR